MHRAKPTVVVIALVALLAGCGSYTKRDFIARADAICASTVRETRSIAPPSFTAGSAGRLRALAGYLAKALPIVKAEDTQIHGLQRPAQSARSRAALNRYLTALTEAYGDYTQLAAAAGRGDTRGMASAEAALGANQVGSLAASYGLHTCGSSGATVA